MVTLSAVQLGAEPCGYLRHILTWLDVLLVGAIAVPAKAAVYAIVSRYVSLSVFPALAVGSAIAPEVSRLLHLDLRRDANKLYRTSAAWITVIGFRILLVLAVSPRYSCRYLAYAMKLGGQPLPSFRFNVGECWHRKCGPLYSWRDGVPGTSWSRHCFETERRRNLILIPRFGLRAPRSPRAISVLVTNSCSTNLLRKFIECKGLVGRWRMWRVYPYCVTA